MKALSVKQPWTWLIGNGHKTIETRTRRTSHRGDLLICSSKKIDSDLRTQVIFNHAIVGCTSPFHLAIVLFREDGWMGFWGKGLYVVNLVDCRPMTPDDETAACVRYQEGLWAWVVENPRPVEIFAVRGMPGIFEVNDELIKIKEIA